MDTLLIIIIIVLAAYVIYTKFFEKNIKGASKELQEESKIEPKEEQHYPYERKNLLTKTEYTFFKVLKAFCEQNNLLFCPKVRMEDLSLLQKNKIIANIAAILNPVMLISCYAMLIYIFYAGLN